MSTMNFDFSGPYWMQVLLSRYNQKKHFNDSNLPALFIVSWCLHVWPIPSTICSRFWVNNLWWSENWLKLWNNKTKLDRGSIRSSLMYGLGTPYRLAFFNGPKKRLMMFSLNMVDYPHVLPLTVHLAHGNSPYVYQGNKNDFPLLKLT